MLEFDAVWYSCSLARLREGIKMSEKWRKEIIAAPLAIFTILLYTFFWENNCIHFNNDMSSLLKEILVATLFAI